MEDNILDKAVKVTKEIKELQISTMTELLHIAERNDIPFEAFPDFVDTYSRNLSSVARRIHTDFLREVGSKDGRHGNDNNSIDTMEVDA